MNLMPEHLLLCHRLAEEARFERERRAFARRHRRVCWPAAMLVIGFVLGVTLMLATTQ